MNVGRAVTRGMTVAYIGTLAVGAWETPVSKFTFAQRRVEAYGGFILTSSSYLSPGLTSQSLASKFGESRGSSFSFSGPPSPRWIWTF